MGKVGREEYPDIPLGKAVEIAARVVKSFGGKIQAGSLGNILGIDPRGGGFRRRVSQLKMYGLLSGERVYHATPLARTIAEAKTPSEGNEAKFKAFLNVKLFQKMHEKFKGSIPENLDDFILNVAEIADGADVDEVRRRAQRLKDFYADALVLKAGGTPKERPDEAEETAEKPAQPVVAGIPFDSDFYLYDAESKTYISIDSLDQLKLAQAHLKNAAKRFQEAQS
jgi:hypothetical protein